MASNTSRWNALFVLIACLWAASARAAFQAGAFAVDVTPTTFPVVVNGNFLIDAESNLNTALKALAAPAMKESSK